MPKTQPFENYSDEYEKWFIDNQFVFQSELKAIKRAMPAQGHGIEVGIGSGIFAEQLGIKEGFDPSLAMREKAEKRNLIVYTAVAEDIPFPDQCRDFILMITTICFVDDIYKAFSEAYRILKDNGSLIIGFVDKNSPVGKQYIKNKDKSIFYKEAIFYGTEELFKILEISGFKVENTYQTVFGKLEEINEVQETQHGYGQGSFVVIRARKRLRK